MLDGLNQRFSNISAWTVDDFRKLLPAIKTLNSSEINSISKEVFESLLDEIEETDDDDLDDDQKEAIIEKVKELYGGKIIKFVNKLSSKITSYRTGNYTEATRDVHMSWATH